MPKKTPKEQIQKIIENQAGIDGHTRIPIYQATDLVMSILRETAMSEDEIEDLLGIWNISEELGLRHKLAKAIREEQLKKLK